MTIFFYTNLARSLLQCLCLHSPLKNHVIMLHVIHIPFHASPFPVSLILFPFLVIFQSLRIKNWGKGITSLVTWVRSPEHTQRQMEKTDHTRLSSQTEIRCPQKLEESWGCHSVNKRLGYGSETPYLAGFDPSMLSVSPWLLHLSLFFAKKQNYSTWWYCPLLSWCLYCISLC